jgi:inner membrane protein
LDNLTHALFGAVMSRVGLNRKTGLATLTLILANEAPDIDIIVRFFNRVEYFAHHRGFTHTFLGIPFVALLVIAVVYGIHRLRLWRGRLPKLPVNWKLLYGYAVLGGLTHIGFDFLNNYGIRPLSPFLHRWFAWDIVSIIEPLMLATLVLALVGPAFFGLFNRVCGERKKPFGGRGAAIAALVFLAALWWFRDIQHRRAVAMLEDELYLGQRPLRLSANPYDTNPFRWHGVIEVENAIITVQVDTLKNQVDPGRNAIVRFKPEETAASLAAKQSRLGQVYLDWARHPYTEVRPREDGSFLVLMRDLRYAYPDVRRLILGVAFEVDQTGRLTEQLVTWPAEALEGL